MKKHLIWTVIILLVGLCAWKIAIPKYKLYKAIQYLDEEFHILKNKDKIAKLEKLDFESLSPALESGDAIGIIRVSKSFVKQFNFKNQTLVSMSFYCVGLENQKKLEIEKNLNHYIGVPLGDTPYFLRWKVAYRGDTYRVVIGYPDFTSEESAPVWKGYEIHLLKK